MENKLKMVLYYFLLPLEITFNIELEFVYDYYTVKHSGSEFLHRKNKFTDVEEIYICKQVLGIGNGFK